MKQSRQSLEQIFQNQAEILSLTLQPFTVVKYQYVARYFVGYLRAEFPEVCRLSQLRRDPHMLGFFRWLCELRPPIGTHTRQQRLLCLRRLLNDLAAQGHPLPPGLIMAGSLGEAPKSKPSRVTSVSNRARRIRRARDMLSRREISSWHRTWRKSRWPRSPACAWARRASRVSSIPDSFRFRSAAASALRSVTVTAVVMVLPP